MHSWGIIGTGRIAHDFVLALQSGSTKGQVVAVASRDATTAANFAAKFQIPHHYSSYEALLQDERVEVVYIATLQNSHCALAVQALEHGKHVLCEKPLAINSTEVETIFATAKLAKRFVMEAVWMRCFPLIRKFEELIQSKAIGDVKSVRVDFGWPNDFTTSSALTAPHHGGGSYNAVGCYVTGLALLAYQSLAPSKISAHGNVVDGIDRSTTTLLRFEDDQHACVTTSIEASLEGEAMIIGTKGKIKIHFPFICPTKLTLYEDNEEEQVFEAQLPSHATASATNQKYNFINSAGLVYEAEEVHRCLSEGLLESPLVPHQFSRALVRISDTIRNQINLRYPMEHNYTVAN